MKHIHNILIPVLVAGVMFFGAQAVYGWIGPAAVPPGQNVPAPINVGSDFQAKKGNLAVNGIAVFGSSIFTGSVKIADGTQGLGKILTSDAQGNASWQFPPEPSVQTTVVPDTSCPTGSSEMTEEGETYCGYVKTWRGGVTYCDGSDRLVRCENAGIGRNNGVTLVSPNGCQAWEGPRNNGGPGARLYCSKGTPR
mgnify:CR=1 FL=1